MFGMNSRTKIVVHGPGVMELFLVAFVVLKLCGVIAWPWWGVLSPLWIKLMFAAIAEAKKGAGE